MVIQWSLEGSAEGQRRYFLRPLSAGQATSGKHINSSLLDCFLHRIPHLIMSAPLASKTTTLHVGVLLLTTVQYLDIGPIDLFGMIRPEFLDSPVVPDHIRAKAQNLEFHYISDCPKGGSVPTSAGARIVTTVCHFFGQISMFIIQSHGPNITRHSKGPCGHGHSPWKKPYKPLGSSLT